MRRLVPYLVAVLAVGVATIGRLALEPVVGPNSLPFITYFAAVTLAAWAGGRGPGTLAIILSYIATDWLFLPEHSGLLELSETSAETLGGMITFIVVCGFIVALTDGLRRSQGELRVEAGRATRHARLLEVTLASIGDAVIATDRDTRITFINAVAEQLTGWSNADAQSRPLVEVFHIVNEFSRQPAEDPCGKVLRTGHVVGLANHTVLVARDGAERPIDDSAAPIIGDGGQILGVVLVFRDVGERRAAARIRKTLAAIVDSSDDAIISKTLDGKITSWNRGAERMFGYTPEEVIGRPISILSAPGKPDETDEIVDRIRAGQRVDHYETTRRGKSGKLVDVSLTVSPIRDSEGNVIGASKIARDITGRKRAEEERDALLVAQRAALAQAEQANRLKDEFLATVSHEIRTPLNAILGWAQILRMGNVSAEELAEGLEVIERSTRTQAQLVADLLDMSRIVSGKIELELQPIDLAAVIESSIVSLRPSVEAKNVQIVRDIRHVEPVTGDAARLQQVVWNLLSNAIKFTPAGGVIRIALAPVDSNVQIVVSDTGQGIDPQFLPFVFDRFRQADSTITRSQGGLGLGLAIVKQLVELHGGTIAADSAGKDQGATFTVTLPQMQRLSEPARELAERVDLPKPDLAGMTVLVVDDEQDARTLLRRVFAGCGATVLDAGSAREALALLRVSRPSVLVSDIGMPGEDGYDLIRQLRAIEGSQDGQIPAVALTAFARSEDRTRALVAGYDSHLTKPVEPAELLAVVAALLGRSPTRAVPDVERRPDSPNVN